MDQINGILRLYSLFILMPILVGCRRKNRTPDDLSGFCFEVLVIQCLAMMGLGAIRLLILSGSEAVVFCQMAEFIFFYLAIGTYSSMLHILVRPSRRHIRTMSPVLKISWLLCLAGIVYWICVTVFRESLPGILSDSRACHFTGQIFGNAVFWIDLCVVLRNRRKLGRRNAQLYFMHVLLPFIGAVIYYLCGGIDMHYIGVTASVLLLYILRNEAHEAQVWREMQLSRLAVMESEIKPHFLFNCINSIYALCAEDAAKASRAANALKKYLEGSFSVLDAGGLVPMETELDHIRNYLALEGLRFGDKLKVSYELSDTGFMIPFLTVQPLVENAVKHGIRRKTGGGTITIKSRIAAEGAEIIVEDDGVGFGPTELMRTGNKHIGLENVRRRLEAELQAELIIVSAPGNGTRVRILIPAEELREVRI